MGIFGTLKERAKRGNVDFIVALKRARKNCVVPYLDEMFEDERSQVGNCSIGKGREKRQTMRVKQSEVKKELSRRPALKQ